MKKILKYLAIVSIVFSFSCTDFLETPRPIGDSVENYYKTQDHAIFAVNAAYAALQFELSEAGHFRWFWGDVMSDDSEKGGAGDNDVPQLARLERFEGPTNTDLLQAEWLADYRGIYRANTVLEYVPNIEMEVTLRDRILGEAKFIRAHFYYTLVTMFGDVPLIEEIISLSEYGKPRTDSELVWDFIEKDLKEAIAVLPSKSEYSTADLGRATKGAAQSYLLKTYMWRNNFQEAQVLAAEIINSGEYELAADYGSIFTTSGEHGPGSIFEIGYMTESGGNWGFHQANEGTFTNVFQRARGEFSGFGFNIPTQDLVDDFKLNIGNDPRLIHCIYTVGDQAGDWGVIDSITTSGSSNQYYPKKYFNNANELATFGALEPNGGYNDRLIRFADVLLLHAEAAALNGDFPAARASLNRVRARVGLGNSTVLEADLLAAIYKERRLELALEGHRFFDLVRTKRAQEELGNIGNGYEEGTHNVFPIPQNEIDLSAGNLIQNFGY